MLKSIEAREIEARGRARHLGVRVQVVRQAREYSSRSQSRPGVVYRIARTSAGWSCGCDGFTYTGVCKHVAAVERRAEREGWTFGTIARPEPTVEPDWVRRGFRVDPAVGLAVLTATRRRS